MKKQNNLVSKFKAVTMYGHPKSVIVMSAVSMISLFFFIVLFNWHLYAISLLSSLFVVVKYKTQKKNRVFYITKTSILSPKIQCIEQRTSFLNKEQVCPRSLFFTELQNLISGLEPDVLYVTATHQKVIDLIKETNEYKDGFIDVQIKPYSYSINLSKMEKNMANKACKNCSKETCKTFQAFHGEKRKEKVELKAVEIRRIK